MYASNTGTKRNLEQMRKFGWRILLSPANPKPREGLSFAIDNGAWTCFQKGLPFESEKFQTLVDKHGGAADFVVIPDIVAGGAKSFEFSKTYWRCSPILRSVRKPLLAVQDGMLPDDVGAFLEENRSMGIFLGGSTEWKLRTMYGWGMVAHALRRWYHVGRVNTVKRLRLAIEAGATSVDGTSATMYSVNLPMLDNASRQKNLLTPGMIDQMQQEPDVYSNFGAKGGAQ